MDGALPFALLKRMSKLDQEIDAQVFGSRPQYTLEQHAELLGVTPEHANNLSHWAGRLPGTPDELRYSEADRAAAAGALKFAAYEGLSQAELGDFVRSMAFAMERLAARQVEAVIQKIVREEHVSDTEARLRAAERVPDLAQEILPLLNHVYLRQFVGATRRLTVKAIAQRGLTNDDDDYPLVRAIGFADLADFTKISATATPGELAELIRTFQSICWDVVNRHKGRVVNFIGDQVFYVADTIADGAAIALELANLATLTTCGTTAHAGLSWSRVITAEGDIFGPGVNLAARLCDAASSGEVLVDAKAAELLALNGKFQVVSMPDDDAALPAGTARVTYAANS